MGEHLDTSVGAPLQEVLNEVVWVLEPDAESRGRSLIYFIN
jgi:hypothetical protein